MPWWGMALLVLLVLAAGALALTLAFYRLALNPKGQKRRVFGASHNAIPRKEEHKKRAEEARAWWESIPNEDIFISAYDGLRLHAHCAKIPWMLPPGP